MNCASAYQPCDSDFSRAMAMAQLFGKDLGFRGNEDDYYNARNSLLPCVIDSRLGIPISLSLLYMIVARRASVVVDGINLPGHFVVRHGDVLLDPFHEGRILTTSDCAQILSYQNRTLHHDHLQTAHPKLILVRMLANLLYISQLEENEPFARNDHAMDSPSEPEMRSLGTRRSPKHGHGAPFRQRHQYSPLFSRPTTLSAWTSGATAIDYTGWRLDSRCDHGIRHPMRYHSHDRRSRSDLGRYDQRNRRRTDRSPVAV